VQQLLLVTYWAGSVSSNTQMESTSVFVDGPDLEKPLASAKCLSSMDFPQGREIIFVCEYQGSSFLKLLGLTQNRWFRNGWNRLGISSWIINSGLLLTSMASVH